MTLGVPTAKKAKRKVGHLTDFLEEYQRHQNIGRQEYYQ